MRECTPSAPISASPRTCSPSSSSSVTPSTILLEVDAARADTHRVGRPLGQCLHQHGMEIAAMHQPVGRAVARLGVGAEILDAPGLAGVEQPHLLGGRHRGDRLHRRQQAECAQHARAVGRDLHAGAELAQLGGLLEERDVEATLQQASAATMPPMPAPAIRMRGLPKCPPLCDGVI